MKTNDLITLLTEDAPVRARLGRLIAVALIAGIVLSGAMLLLTVGLRQNLGQALGSYRVLAKITFTLLLAVAACGLVSGVGRPGVALRARALGLLVPLVLLALAVIAELAILPRSEWPRALEGNNPVFCLFFIPTLSIVPLAGLLLALREGAPQNPGLAGASAGLAAGGIAAALYAWHCPDDSPLFCATWYGIAIGCVSLVGWGLGRRLLRW